MNISWRKYLYSFTTKFHHPTFKGLILCLKAQEIRL